MRIGLIRHGKTDWNALGKIQGQTDTPLNEEGIRQAHALAERLSRESQRWDAVVSSDLSRASQTADIIARKLGIARLSNDVRIRERYFGLVEGTTEEERLTRWGKEWRKADCGQESDESVRKRAGDFVQELSRTMESANVLIVTHGSLLAQLLRVLCSELQDKPIGNMSLSVFERAGEKWVPLLHNCTLHLEQPQN